MPNKSTEEAIPRLYINKKEVFPDKFEFVCEDMFDGEFMHLLHNPKTGEYKKEPCTCDEEGYKNEDIETVEYPTKFSDKEEDN